MEKADSHLPLIKVLRDAKMTVHVLADDTETSVGCHVRFVH